MCGICGFLNLEDDSLLAGMMESIHHRGPDDKGVYTNEHVSLGHQRLSIIDLAMGHQPLSNEEGTVWICFNGEIYNYLALREELEEQGHRFATNSDTEVIVHLYEEHGPGFESRLWGVWAFALYDEGGQRVIISRDRLGVKPVYYLIRDGMLFFASEPKAILRYEGYTPEVELDAVKNFLGFRYNNLNKTLFLNIEKVPPATSIELTMEGGRFAVETGRFREYWAPVFNEAGDRSFINEATGKIDVELVAKELRRELEASVWMRLMSEVPLGVYLSGGLDSSSIVAMMKKDVETPITYSIGFGGGVDDELEYSRFLAEHFETDHHEIIVEPEATEFITRVIYQLDEPMADFATIPVYLMSQKAKKDLTVVLTGEGNDEIWGGYANYREQLRFMRYRRFLPTFLGSALGGLARLLPHMGSRKRLLHYAKFLDEKKSVLSYAPVFNEFDELLTPETLNKVDPTPPRYQSSGQYFGKEHHLITRMLLSDMKTLLPNSYLMKADRMTMAHAIEARVPLIDHRIVELSFKIPPRLKINQGMEKFIFRQAVKDLLPEKIRRRRKQGFSVPRSVWVRSSEDFVKDLLTQDTTKKRGYFRQEYITRLMRDFREMDEPRAQKLWCLVTLELWHRLFIDRTLKP